jgi:hypothetical protein
MRDVLCDSRALIPAIAAEPHSQRRDPTLECSFVRRRRIEVLGRNRVPSFYGRIPAGDGFKSPRIQ